MVATEYLVGHLHDQVIHEVSEIRDQMRQLTGEVIIVVSDKTLHDLTYSLGVQLGAVKPGESLGKNRINRLLGMEVQMADMKPDGCLFFYLDNCLRTILDTNKCSRYEVPQVEYLPRNRYAPYPVH